tara:strand:- start:349 stop:534 length:186 start_codon:yes stop_codon:yes gene_type:complete
MKKVFIKDDNGDNYLVNNIDKFKKHIFKYHSYNNQGDNSIHEENGRYFTVTKKFYKMIENL